MKILFLTNNEITYSLFNWLKHERMERVILFEERINLDKIMEIEPDIVISYNYKYIIKKDIIQYMRNKIINLHISMLPWNRGASPNFWSFIDNTPKGITIHIIDEGLDTGDILFQKEMVLDERKETLKTSYKKLHEEIQYLFKQNWDKIKNWDVEFKTQTMNGSIHFAKDFEYISKKLDIDIFNIPIIDLKEKYKHLKE